MTLHPLVKKWIEVLRTTDKKQGIGRLRTLDNKYCCLGIYCDVKGGEWKEDIVRSKDSFIFHPNTPLMYNEIPNYIANLPTSFLIEIGMSNEFASDLMWCNDDAKLSFPVIAFLVENHFNDSEYMLSLKRKHRERRIEEKERSS